MSRIRTEYLDADASDRWFSADVLLREEPNQEEEDEEEDEGDSKEDDKGDDYDDAGYSVGLPLRTIQPVAL